MPTKNPRINITFEAPLLKIVSTLAKHEHRSVSSLAKELIIEALERREDQALSTLAEIRDKKKSKTMSHDNAWK